MTEPVAYRVDGTIYNNINDAEFAVREIKHLRDMLEADNGLIRKLVYIEPLYTAEQLQNKIEMTKDEFELLAKVCRGIQPFQKIEQHIKVLPDMKWFVRSKVSDDGYYSYLFKHSNRPIADYEPSKQPRKEYMTFDTKEEAELWTNPLTEAVQLAVEEE